VLERPCYAKFMVVPNYTYLKLKMSGPSGVITVSSTYRHAYECDVECVEYAEALAESKALIADLESLSREAPDAKRHVGNFKPAETCCASISRYVLRLHFPASNNVATTRLWLTGCTSPSI
jgi:hypothetical protein